MLALNRHDQEAIAELLHNAGYRRLLELMSSSEAAALDDIESEADPAKLLRAMRWWQFLRKVNRWLAETPATIEAELSRLKEDAGRPYADWPASRDQAWAMRFAPEAAEGDTSDPASI